MGQVKTKIHRISDMKMFEPFGREESRDLYRCNLNYPGAKFLPHLVRWWFRGRFFKGMKDREMLNSQWKPG